MVRDPSIVSPSLTGVFILALYTNIDGEWVTADREDAEDFFCIGVIISNNRPVFQVLESRVDYKQNSVS